jgi:hypothetical protein
MEVCFFNSRVYDKITKKELGIFTGRLYKKSKPEEAPQRKWFPYFLVIQNIFFRCGFL